MSSGERFALVLRDVEVDGARIDVGITDDRVVAVAPRLGHPAAPTVVGHGGALLPGLHDHHLHLLAAAAARDSVDCTGMTAADEFTAGLRQAPVRDGWVRAVGYHESIAGQLDRGRLDELRNDVPVRVQHRTGALWMLNSPALARVAHVLDDSADVERDGARRPNGRLWRYDARLRAAVRHRPPSLAAVSQELAAHGVTSVTDATPKLTADTLALLGRAHATGELAQDVTLLGAPAGCQLAPGLSRGPWKLHLRDHDLPSLGQLMAEISDAHRLGRAVAVHCVTLDALALTIAALRKAGPHAGDRIEHAAVVPPELVPDLAGLGVAVVTQPSFLHRRGADYLREVAPEEQSWLYPWASLVAAGIPVAPSSDAPHGSISPWEAVAAAAMRATADGRPVARAERVHRAAALAGYLSPASAPGTRPRHIAPGVRADLVLLNSSLSGALAAAPANPVRLTLIGGRIVHDAGLSETSPVPR